MHLLHLTYQTSNLGLLHCVKILYHLSHQGSPLISKAYLKYVQNTYINLQPAKSSNQSLFYNKVLDISHNLLDTVLKVKIRMVVLVQNVCRYNGYLPSGSSGLLGVETCRHSLPSWESMALHISSSGKDQNSKYSF